MSELDEIFGFLFAAGDGGSDEADGPGNPARWSPPRPAQSFAESSFSVQFMSSLATANDMRVVALPMSPDDSVRLEGTPDHPELVDVGIGSETVSKPVFAGPCLDGTDLLKGNAPQAEESTVYEVLNSSFISIVCLNLQRN